MIVKVHFSTVITEEIEVDDKFASLVDSVDEALDQELIDLAYDSLLDKYGSMDLCGIQDEEDNYLLEF